MTLVLMILWVIQLIGVIYTINKTYLFPNKNTMFFNDVYLGYISYVV